MAGLQWAKPGGIMLLRACTDPNAYSKVAETGDAP